MSKIGEIVTAADIKSMEQYLQKSAPQTGYVAPTVYRNAKVSSWNYYSTLDKAIQQWGYLNGKPGYTKQTAAGSIAFNTAATETMGINVDFYFPIPIIGFVNAPYAWVRTVFPKAGFSIPIRFYKTNGAGPYYAVISNDYFGVSATVIKNVAPDKLAAMDSFYKEVQLFKYKYNSLANYLNALSKNQLTAVQQQTFNEGVLLLNNMQNQIKQIKGVEINFGNNGDIKGIGVIPILVIVLIALVAGVAGWTLITITTEIQKTQRLNASYDLQKWISDQNLKIEKDGSLTREQKDALKKRNAEMATEAQKNAAASTTTEPGFMDKIQNVLLLAIVGLGILKFIPQRNN